MVKWSETKSSADLVDPLGESGWDPMTAADLVKIAVGAPLVIAFLWLLMVVVFQLPAGR